MSVETVSHIKRRLSCVIKKFKFEELESAVMPTFPEIKWKHIQMKLVKHHESFTVKSALRVIEEAINRLNLQEPELKSRLLTLETVEISRHSKKKTWYCYALKHPQRNTVDYIGRGKFHDKIRKNFISINMHMDVNVLRHEGITFICLKEYPKKSRIRLPIPTAFAVFNGEAHFFCSKKVVSRHVIQTIVTSMGFESSKQIQLTGHDLWSLIKLLWNKKQKLTTRDEVHRPIAYTEPEPSTTIMGRDYTQRQQRRKYAEQTFGTDAPVLEKFSVSVPGQAWYDSELMRKVPDKIDFGFEVHSRNIASCLTTLVEHKILVPPLPPYIADFMSQGRNHFTIKTDVNRS